MIIEYPFDVAGNYIFNANEIKVENGEASLKSLVKSSETCFCNFDSLAIKRSRDSGSLVVTPGGADVLNKWLDLEHDDVRYVRFLLANNVDFSGNKGCVRFKLKTGYSGAPTTLKNFFKAGIWASNNSSVEIFHHTNGALYWEIYNSVGVIIVNGAIAWNPTAATIYEFELNFNTIALEAATRMFINGEQNGTTKTGTGDIGTGIDGIIGVDISVTSKSDFSVTDVQCFEEVQHTSNFTGEIPRAEPTTYAIDDPSITTGAQSMDGLELFEATIEKTGSDNIKHVVNYDWFDTTWKDSNETYAESNLAADIETNKASLDLSDGFNVPIKSLLHSDDGYSTPKLKNIKLGYNFFIAPDADVNECMISIRMDDIFQDLTDFTGLNAELIVELEHSFQQGDRTVFKNVYPITFNSEGYAEISIRETASVNKKVKFKIKYIGKDENGTDVPSEIVFKDAIIPDIKSRKLSEITSIITE